MNVDDRMLTREWSKLTYRDPEVMLRELRRIELGLPDGTRLRRSRDLNPILEWRQAALFAYGLGCRFGTRFGFAPAPAQDLDYDFVLCFDLGDGVRFQRLQLKELVPEDVNPRATIDGLLADVEAKYGRAPHLCVAIYMNRRLPARPLAIPTGAVGGLWLFGGVDPHKRRWALHGDLLQPDRRVSEFVYPEPQVTVATPRLILPRRRR